MRVELTGVAKGRKGQALPPTSLAFDHEAPRIAHAETEQRPTVLGLIASGRMKPDTGTVLIDGETDRRALRRRVCLVDAPSVSDPAPNVWVSAVTAEELMFAGQPSNPVSVRRWLQDAGFGALWRTPIADVSPRERIALLLELTALRSDVDGIVLVAPDRHGGDPLEWWSIVEDFAARGYAMLVIAGAASAAVLGERATRAELDPAPIAEVDPGSVDVAESVTEAAPAAEAESVDQPGSVAVVEPLAVPVVAARSESVADLQPNSEPEPADDSGTPAESEPDAAPLGTSELDPSPDRVEEMPLDLDPDPAPHTPGSPTENPPASETPEEAR